MRTATKTVAALSALMLLGSAAAASAQGWTRSATTTGPYGYQVHTQGGGSCSGGTCQSHTTKTGPSGHTVTRDRQTTCSGGTCNRTVTTTDRLGRSYTRSGSVTRY